jgi:hypothetical protein
VDHVQIGAGTVVHAVDSAAQVRNGGEDQRERGAELVADVGEERRLRAVEFGEFLGATLLCPITSGAADLGRQVRGHQVDETPVGVVQRSEAVQRSHQETAR